MAVHTPLQIAEIRAYLDEAGLSGALLERAEGVAEGSIHTTYRLWHAGRIRYLRRYEEASLAAIEHELALLAHLTAKLPARAGAGAGALMVPKVVAHADGQRHGPLLGAQAALFEEVPGTPLEPAALTAAQLTWVGETIGAIRLASAGFGVRRENPYGPAVVDGWLSALESEGGEGEIARVLPTLRRAVDRGRGAVVASPADGAWRVGHGDLFPDNLHWQEGRVVGVLDLEMACDLPTEWDLAVGLLVFCWGPAGLEGARARALVKGFAEAGGGPFDVTRLLGALHFVAARYATSRIRDFARSGLPAAQLVHKDWREFARRLDDLEDLDGSGLAKALSC